jgi:hypothetical protein
MEYHDTGSDHDWIVDINADIARLKAARKKEFESRCNCWIVPYAGEDGMVYVTVASGRRQDHRVVDTMIELHELQRRYERALAADHRGRLLGRLRALRDRRALRQVSERATALLLHVLDAPRIVDDTPRLLPPQRRAQAMIAAVAMACKGAYSEQDPEGKF